VENVLIKFEADWCFPCKAMTPIVEDFAKNNPHIKVMSVDIEGDGIHNILGKFEVRSVPTFIRTRNGSTIKRMVGAVSRGELSTMVDG
jgi:thioredoxin 1